MRKKLISLLLLGATCAGAQVAPDWENLAVIGINKERYHTTLTLPSWKADCKEIILLNGKWQFKWSPDPGSRPVDFYKNDFLATVFHYFIYSFRFEMFAHFPVERYFERISMFTRSIFGE